jgi:hypothetical protein
VQSTGKKEVPALSSKSLHKITEFPEIGIIVTGAGLKFIIEMRRLINAQSLNPAPM